MNWYAVTIAKNLGFRAETEEIVTGDGEVVQQRTGRSVRIVGEFDAERRFREDGFEAIAPRLAIPVRPHRRAKQRRVRHVPLIPGYTFVRWDRVPTWLFDVWPEVTGVLRKPECLVEPYTLRSIPTGRYVPAIIPDEQIKALHALNGTDVPLDRARRLKAGDRARITEGPFAGESAYAVESVHRRRAVMLLDFLGRVEVPIESLERVG
jgi:transcription antitermination factor NusG